MAGAGDEIVRDLAAIALEIALRHMSKPVFDLRDDVRHRGVLPVS